MLTNAFTVKSVELERLASYAVRQAEQRDDRSIGLEPKIEQRIGYALDELVYTMRSYVWAQELQNDTSEATVTLEAEVPADWWQHLKERWFSAWALKRWPVLARTIRKTETVTHKFRCLAALPDFKYIPPPGCGPRYVFKTMASATRGSDGY